MTTTASPRAIDLPEHLERYRVNGSIDLTRPPDEELSNEDRLILMRAAIAEGDADFEAGRYDDAEVVFARIRRQLFG